MVKFLKFIADIINRYHDKVADYINLIEYPLNDKQLHFIIIALVGFAIFIFTQILFRILSKFSITAISFIYTFTVLIVIVFAIEIEQALTGRGAMEFSDIAYGLYGFLCVFTIYLLLRLLLWGIKKCLISFWEEIKTLSWRDF